MNSRPIRRVRSWLQRSTSQKPLLLRAKLWQQVLLAMFLGIGVGLLLSPSGAGLLEPNAAYSAAQWVALPGNLFLGLIQMVIIPLVMSSIILGIASGGDMAFLRKVGSRIGVYFVATTFIAVGIGVTVAGVVGPGRFVQTGLVEMAAGGAPQTVAVAPLEPEDMTVPGRIARLIPSNPIQSQVDRDMLAIVVYAIFVGVSLIALEKRHSKLLVDLMTSVQALAMNIVNWAMLLAPLAVFGLLCDITIRVGIDALLGVSVYVGSVILGLLLLMAVYLSIVAMVGGRNPIRFLRNIREPQLLGFSTSSSAAVMPLSMKTAHERLGVRPAIAQFVIPVGATVNMDGTALYQMIAAVFLTQVFGIELSGGALVVLAATTVGASIGAPSTPGVGIVILATILSGIGVPTEGIALILGVDRILDMCRTSVNVTGDLTACVVIERWIGDSIPEPRTQQPLPEVS